MLASGCRPTCAAGGQGTTRGGHEGPVFPRGHAHRGTETAWHLRLQMLMLIDMWMPRRTGTCDSAASDRASIAAIWQGSAGGINLINSVECMALMQSSV